jgi:hypothetical protein
MEGIMNPSNYGAQPACQRLLDAGIVLETDFHWIHNKLKDTWKIGVKTLDMENHPEFWELIPAVQFAEVWRELPERIKVSGEGIQRTTEGGYRFELTNCWLTMQRAGGITEVGYEGVEVGTIVSFENINPTDALIDLLIWTVQQKEGV